MNRERMLYGGNGYDRALGFDPVAFLEWRVRTRGRARWLDLCCGSGRALIDAAERFAAGRGVVDIHGLDLVDRFDPQPPDLCLTLEVGSVHDWQAPHRYDLITCVHGLHYIGDKLGTILRAASWLTADGQLYAHLDLRNLKLSGGRSASRLVPGALRAAGLEYDRRLVRCRGRVTASLPLVYLGADDAAGPNYTGQPAVDAHYRLQEPG